MLKCSLQNTNLNNRIPAFRANSPQNEKEQKIDQFVALLQNPVIQSSRSEITQKILLGKDPNQRNITITKLREFWNGLFYLLNVHSKDEPRTYLTKG